MTVAATASDDFLGHPKGVYVCFFTEMWERFSFYGMKALLLLYLTKYHLFGDKAGLDLLGAYGGLVYCIPVFGGMLADRWLGMRRAVLFGGILLVLGHLGMAFEGHAAYRVNGEVVRDTSALAVTYLSLALIIMGVGFLKPNVSTIVGRLYREDDPRRDSGFSLFVAGINLGALFASIVCGYLGQTFGWKYGFGAAGIGMVLGLIQFLWGRKYLRGIGEPPAPLAKGREFGIYAVALAAVFAVAWLMQAVTVIKLGPDLVRWTFGIVVMALAGIVWSMWYSARRDDAAPKPVLTYAPSMAAFALLGLAALLFLFFITRHLRRRENEVLADPSWLRQLEAPTPIAQLEAEGPPPSLIVQNNPRKKQIEEVVTKEPERVAVALRTWMNEP